MEVKAVDAAVFSDEIKEIRISHYSESSGRCPPLAVLHTITSAGICFKLESPARNLHSPLALMHATCLRDNKAAVTFIGEEEVQLVAMQSRKYEGQCPFFWGFNVSSSLYNSCVVMLDLRCLGIVFDLDETLVVANTMRSFEDRIDSLQRKMGLETDPQRVSGMLAEVKRYQEDKIILKQYAETDQVTDNGKVYKAQSEVVLAMSDDQQTIIRPLIRLQDKNIILTRINPLIRDTSVLVRLRPAWEDLRSYLTAKGRKRFEVFVCTMAERDYALEMWRLLDPESSLINLMDLSNRIVCVKSGSRKSLFNVFQDGTCHPKMALVIDDRLKVWDEKDQSRVHVVPAFTPYFAPQAEANNVTPILCVARNVACNVRGSFFKDFDDGLLPRISEVAFEDDAKDMPSTPDVGNYLTSEDDNSGGSTAYKDVLVFDAMADLEVERRVKDAAPAASTVATQIIGLDPRLASALQYVLPSSSFSVVPPKAQVPDLPPPLTQQVAKLIKPPLPQHGQMETILHNSPGREEGEVPESELDPDTRRRLLILQHGQDVREPPPNEPPFAGRPPPLQVPPPRVTQPGWFPVEDEMSMRQLNRAGPSMEFNGEIPMGRHRSHHPPFLHKAADSSIFMGRPRKNLRKEELASDDQLRSNQPSPNFHHFSRSEDSSVAKLSSLDKGLDFESGQIDPSIETFAGALHEIGLKCGTKVEFKHALVPSVDMQFSSEVFFAGRKIGKGIGNTRREAQRRAAEDSLLFLADKYLSQLKSDSLHSTENQNKLLGGNDFISEAGIYYQASAPSTSSTQSSLLESNFESSRKSISALKELCTVEGLEIAYQTRPNFSVNNRGQKGEVYAEVEINGQVLGKGIGLTWDEAKGQASDNALGVLRPMLSQSSYRSSQDSPRSIVDGGGNKRSRTEFPRPTRLSMRHSRNTSAIP